MVTTELTARILKRSSAKTALTEFRGHGSKKGAFANKLKNETYHTHTPLKIQSTLINLWTSDSMFTQE